MEEEKVLRFEIVEELVTLSQNNKWSKQLNIVQWGDNVAKYDIRSWNDDHSKAGKGVTLTLQELIALKKFLLVFDI